MRCLSALAGGTPLGPFFARDMDSEPWLSPFRDLEPAAALRDACHPETPDQAGYSVVWLSPVGGTPPGKFTDRLCCVLGVTVHTIQTARNPST